MKVFLQNTKTQKFLMSDGGWATGGREVRDFKSSADAVVFSVENHLDDMQVILRFDDSRYDEKLQLVSPTPSGKSRATRSGSFEPQEMYSELRIRNRSRADEEISRRFPAT